MPDPSTSSKSEFIAALPMYDWPECRDEVDAQWAVLSQNLRAAGINAPLQLVRRNGDMPAVPGGIRDSEGTVIAPDPSSLPPDQLDLHTLWRHPALLYSQTCWGPMELGLAHHVQVIAQHDYSSVEGGKGNLYRSAIVGRRNENHNDVLPPSDASPCFRLESLRGKRLAYNSADSMSGILGLERDLACVVETLEIFSELVETGGHRLSIVAVAEKRADIAAIDCATWQLAKRFEPATEALTVVGWTALRKGLPFIASKHIPDATLDLMSKI
ncbi:ABC-type phosphate/phosphonate transport system, periplasmic component [Poronia punctata]|nr:ABC-type phosphate/phosphonate transport system, periplasmic component [Poronia punctata]